MKEYKNIDTFNFTLRDVGEKYGMDIRERTFRFSVEVMKFFSRIPNKKEYDVFRYQLSKSATSIGANLEEAQSSNLREFVHKLRIALRESHETNYWLRLLKEVLTNNSDLHIEQLIKESHEIELILGSIVSKLNKKLKENSHAK